MFRVSIRTDNAAFFGEREGDYQPGPEVARILRRIAVSLEDGHGSGQCRDVNGNRVGQWSDDREAD